jgi:hypothetical protein
LAHRPAVAVARIGLAAPPAIEAGAVVEAQTTESPAISAGALARLAVHRFSELPPSPTPPPVPPALEPVPAPNTVAEGGTRDQISILACICKRLPKSPNPDPRLTW